jgi:hypothetical protein
MLFTTYWDLDKKSESVSCQGTFSRRVIFAMIPQQPDLFEN